MLEAISCSLVLSYTVRPAIPPFPTCSFAIKKHTALTQFQLKVSAFDMYVKKGIPLATKDQKQPLSPPVSKPSPLFISFLHYLCNSIWQSNKRIWNELSSIDLSGKYASYLIRSKD